MTNRRQVGGNGEIPIAVAVSKKAGKPQHAFAVHPKVNVHGHVDCSGEGGECRLTFILHPRAQGYDAIAFAPDPPPAAGPAASGTVPALVIGVAAPGGCPATHDWDVFPDYERRSDHELTIRNLNRGGRCYGYALNLVATDAQGSHPVPIDPRIINRKQ